MRDVEDDPEIEALYVLHGPALTLLAQSVLGNRSCPQDVVHKVFLDLMESQALQRATDKAAYLFKCVRNAVLNESKRQHRNTPLTPDSAWFDPPHRDFAEERSLRRALLALPEDQSQVVVLHIWGELSFAQIGEVLGIPTNTAASRYRYGLSKLRTSMLEKESFHVESKR